MGELSDDLASMGYVPEGKESPFDDAGELWTNGVELVCDETAKVLRNDEPRRELSEQEGEYFRYPNSNRVRMPGGYFGSYSWGYDDDTERFVY